MSKKQKTRNSALASAKHAPHKRHTKDFLKVYAPYIPLVLIVTVGFWVGLGWRMPGTDQASGVTGFRGVLAYATDMSINGLLQATNGQRVANGLPGLGNNSKLNSSAQNKANDMVARNYWSHNTPEGQEPWIFFVQAGYDYQKAGENLAYGFATSNDTVTGWMNSPSHRANILDSGFSEVGFGFANGSNYVGNGSQTVVVAHYAKPLNGTPAAPPASGGSSTPQSNGTSNSKPTPTPVTPTPAAPVPTPTPTPEAPPDTSKTPVTTKDDTVTPVNTDQPVVDSEKSIFINGLQTIFGTNAGWIGLGLSIALSAAIVIWVTKHAIVVRRMIVHGEKFVVHHPLVDVTIIAFVALVVLLTRTAGVIK